jgi:methyl-accepting chemotaxis protein
MCAGSHGGVVKSREPLPMVRAVRSRQSRFIAAVIAAVVVVCGLVAFVSQRWLSNAAFGNLESEQAAQYAQRVKIALDYEVKLLANYGSTNSIWSGSYDAVAQSNKADFLSDFSPSVTKTLNGVDGVIGVGPDGSYRVGGLTTGGGATFEPLPAALTSTSTLSTLIDPSAEPGVSKCGLLTPDATPYAFCSFRSYNDDAAGKPVGNLIFLLALNKAKLAQLSQIIGMPLTLVTKQHSGKVSTLKSTLGNITVTTATVSSDKMVLDAAVPTTSGSDVLLEFTRPRPIHAVATSWSEKSLAVIGGILLLIIGVVAVGIRRAVRAKVQPLRETAEQIISSGDRSLRINSADTSEIGALAQAIDTMLDSLAEREREIAEAQREREEQLQAAAEHDREREAELRARAEESITAATSAIMDELNRIRTNTAEVHSAANTIEQRVEASTKLTHAVLSQSQSASAAVEELSSSLQNIAGVAEMIAGVAKQTNLLALNATIEAARAGEAGKGFSVVANEVKELAIATSAATAEITSTIEKLRMDAVVMSGAITEVQSGVAEIDNATRDVNGVTMGQRETAQVLNSSVDQAIDRLRAIDTFA